MIHDVIYQLVYREQPRAGRLQIVFDSPFARDNNERPDPTIELAVFFDDLIPVSGPVFVGLRFKLGITASESGFDRENPGRAHDNMLEVVTVMTQIVENTISKFAQSVESLGDS